MTETQITPEEAIERLRELQSVVVRITHIENTRREGVGPGNLRRERKAITAVLSAMLGRDPTPEEVERATFK